MKKEVEEKLLEGIDEIIGFLNSTKDFAVEQAPLVAQEILSYELFRSGVLWVAFLLVVIGFIASLLVLFRYMTEEGGNKDEALKYLKDENDRVFLYVKTAQVSLASALGVSEKYLPDRGCDD